MLKWKKLGQIFDPFSIPTPDWMHEYGQLPFPMEVDDEMIRIYFATRPKKDSDLQYVSRSAFIDVKKKDQTKIVNVASGPIFDLGGPGTFDEFGCMTSSFIRLDNEIRAYYTGWTRMQGVPYTMAIGMASSTDGGTTFEKYSEGPILGITSQEPFLLSGPIVKIIKNSWHMWYLTGTKWLHDTSIGKFEPVYKIAHATSNDGIHWTRNGKPVIPSLTEDECQVSFALFFEDERWNAIFAHRQPLDFRSNSENAYRLGYASSTDLLKWTRDDSQIEFDVSSDGWDSEMICYPQIGQFCGKTYLYYCGNDFGRVGFGFAEMDAN